MDRSGFQFEFHRRAPYLAFELIAEADSRLSALAADHPDIASASVDVEEVIHDENPGHYLARVIIHNGPESI